MKDAVEPPVDRHRLPRSAVPVRYDLTLEPDLAAATFTGHCATELDVVEETNVLVLNAIELDVRRARLVGDDGTELRAELIATDPDTERLTIELAAAARPGRWVLHTEFHGTLNDKLHGFYRSTFVDADGAEQVIATTQFEATDARRAFPCWDEPDFKAVFAVTLVVEPDQFAVSNAAEVSRDARPDGKHVVRFADTMVMSTYLVAFIVGPLEATEPVDVDGTPLRVVSPRGKGHLTDYALEVGAFCLRFFSDYYGIAYPGDKLDLVAVPDFAFGAMENLGCVTFREVLVLVDPDTSTQPELQRVTDVIAHELAHMWFGDLVTMRWWNGIWLNEAFATFMEMLATDAFRPDWDRWANFGLSRSAAFDVDALTATRPVEYPVVSPEDAEGMFDILTYEKGAAVVRMLEQYLGPDAFRDGIRRYLADNAYGNTETTDLWDALEAATGEPVRRIMDSWIFQGGFPVIDVDLLDEGSTLRLTQQRFAYAGDLTEEQLEAAAIGRRRMAPTTEGSTSDDEPRWAVPLIFSQGSGGVTTFERLLLDGESTDVALYEAIDWVLVNTEGTGFYRAQYAPTLRDALVGHTQAELSAVERYVLIDDTWASVLAGQLDTFSFLGVLERFADEEDLAVWERIVAGCGALDRLVDDDDARARLHARIRNLLRPALQRLGTTPAAGDDDRRRALRGTLLEAMGVLGRDGSSIHLARELHDRAESGEAVDPALAAAAVSVVAATGGTDEFEAFLARSGDAATPQEELRYLSALADFEHPDLIDRLVELTLTDAVRTQNAPYLLRRALTNRTQGPRAWAFVAARWDDLRARFPSNSIVRMLEGIRSLSHPSIASEVFAFFEVHEVPQGDKILAQHLERLEVNVALRARESAVLTRHLLDHH